MQTLFICSTAVLVYVYFGYPLLISVLSRLSRPHTRDESYRPSVCILVAAYEEAAVIRQKMDNFRQIQYPEDLLRIVVVSDGSTDGTDDIVREFSDPRITLLRQEPRAGKSSALAMGLEQIFDDVVVLTDANTMFDPQAVTHLVTNLADPSVGVVTGEVRLVDDKPGYTESEGAYYKYEMHLQACESRFWSVMGVDGALYATRRELIEAPDPATILDDFTISMEIAKRGHRIVFEPRALAYEDAPPHMDDEFKRKTRTAAGAFQSLHQGWGVPRHNARLILPYVSHKLLRWLSPCFMLLSLVSNIALVATADGTGQLPNIWITLLASQSAFYLAAAAGLLLPVMRSLKFVSVPMYLVLMNAAMANGLLRFLRGQSSVRWNRTKRSDTTLPTGEPSTKQQEAESPAEPAMAKQR